MCKVDTPTGLVGVSPKVLIVRERGSRAPQVSNITGSAAVVGKSFWLDQRTITQPAAIVESGGCLISYIAEFNNSSSSWIVTEIRYPKQLVC